MGRTALRISIGLWVLAIVATVALTSVGWLSVSDELGPELQVQEWAIKAGIMGLLVLCFLSMVLGVVVVLIAITSKRAAVLYYLLLALPPPILFVGTLVLAQRVPMNPTQVRDDEFSALAKRSQALTDALARYMDERGSAAPTLNALVPGYLPEVPGTGIERFPEYKYRIYANGIPEGELLWYDLGPTPDKLGALDDWRYGFLGSLEHAVLIVVLDRHDTVIATDTDRLPSSVEQRPFDESEWRTEERTRLAMLDDAREKILAASAEELASLLGPEDGRQELPAHDYGAPYELQVPCPLGMLNWDVFVFWPDGDYPTYMYGGGVELVGDWAYVHE